MGRSLALLAAFLAIGGGLVACTPAGGDNGGGNGGGAVIPGVAGTWRASTTYDCFGQLSDEMIFMTDGHFSRLTTTTEANCVPTTLAVRTTGDYQVYSSQGVIQLSNIQREPKEQCLPGGGCRPVLGADSDTLSYTMPDSSTLTLSCGPGCNLTYAKAGP